MKTLSLYIMDIAQNAIRARATEISIEIYESGSQDLLMITVKDNSIIINDKLPVNVTDPFVTANATTSTGTGLMLLKYLANITGGDIKTDSKENDGTKVYVTFTLSHSDRKPLGDIAGVVTILVAAHPDIDFNYKHITDVGEYRFSTRETKELLEVNTLAGYDLLNMIGTDIYSNLKKICIADLN